MKRFTPPSAARLADPKAEESRRDIADRIRELQVAALSQPDAIANVVLRDGVETYVPHKLGRKPLWVKESCVRGAVTTGHVEDVRDAIYDRTKYVVLKAVGWGADITVDLAVM